MDDLAFQQLWNKYANVKPIPLDDVKNKIPWPDLTDEQFAQFKDKLGLRLNLAQNLRKPPDTDTPKYKDMATPSDPAFAVFKRNFEVGNFWYWFGTFWKEMPESERLPVLKQYFAADGELKPTHADLNTKNTDGLPSGRQDEIRNLLIGMMKKTRTANLAGGTASPGG